MPTPSDAARFAAPQDDHVIATPADTDLGTPANALYIWEAGNLEFTPVGSDSVKIGPYAVVAGQLIPTRTIQVNANTTATVGLLF